MNVVWHALAGGAVAHVAARIAGTPGRRTMLAAHLAAIASHGLLDWLKHGYPVPSRLDVVLALILTGTWLWAVEPRLRLLFTSTLSASFLPDVVDHPPRLLHLTSPLPTPLLPWHARAGSGSLYPAAQLRAGSGLVALEQGHNQLSSTLNHALVTALCLLGIFIGRAAFRGKLAGAHAKSPA